VQTVKKGSRDSRGGVETPKGSRGSAKSEKRSNPSQSNPSGCAAPGARLNGNDSYSSRTVLFGVQRVGIVHQDPVEGFLKVGRSSAGPIKNTSHIGMSQNPVAEAIRTISTEVFLVGFWLITIRLVFLIGPAEDRPTFRKPSSRCKTCSCNLSRQTWGRFGCGNESHTWHREPLTPYLAKGLSVEWGGSRTQYQTSLHWRTTCGVLQVRHRGIVGDLWWEW
jgi:hypothetical protein